jgi:hypothetical protein
MDIYNDFINAVQQSLQNHEFVKITLSKPAEKDSALVNVYIRRVTIKELPKLSFTYRNKTNDQVKNFEESEGLIEVKKMLTANFKSATLFTTQQDLVLQVSKKGKATLTKLKPSAIDKPSEIHDREKIKRAQQADVYLFYLGITDKEGNVIPKMADKYRQINKYLEIIDGLMQTASLPQEVHVVDMGSGKGYLTFALYDFLCNKKNKDVHVTGIELRKDLVDYCNSTAQQCGFKNLNFECKPIEQFDEKKIDILIALHACDTATDDALRKGIVSNAALIICAPCCHKQIRQQVKGKEQESPILKYGIFKERQFEMVTDTIRALILEKEQYQTNIFEFVSNEHTRKNIMLVGCKTSNKSDKKVIDEKIDSIKKEFGIEFHYLEKIIDRE